MLDNRRVLRHFTQRRHRADPHAAALGFDSF
jgi:hypothetical protein